MRHSALIDPIHDITTSRYEPKLGRDGSSENTAHKHRIVAVDKISELDEIIAK